MPRAEASYLYHLGVDSSVFKYDKSETEAKTNYSGPRVRRSLSEVCSSYVKNIHKVRS